MAVAFPPPPIPPFSTLHVSKPTTRGGGKTERDMKREEGGYGKLRAGWWKQEKVEIGYCLCQQHYSPCFVEDL